MFVTKYISNRVFDYIDPWGEILSSVAWAVRALHHSNLNKTPAQLVFGRDMIINLSTVVDWKTLTMRKKAQVDQDNQQENTKRIKYDYAVGNQAYVRIQGIKHKPDNTKKGPYSITQVFTNGTVRIQQGSIN